MGYITYKQADSRWGKKNYNGSSSMATAGCGPTSVAMLAYAVDGKTNPWDVAKYMKSNGYAIRNNGTAWAGIPSAMKHFGLINVKEVSKMTDVWSYMSQGYAAVFLFRGGSKGGITWTSSGHYVAVTDYKVKDGKHYLYTRDSGGRNHTGWYCYETQMKGLIPKIWVGLVKKMEVKTVKKPTGKFAGPYPTVTIKRGSEGNSVKLWQNFLRWYGFAVTSDGDFGAKTETATRSFQKTENITTDGIVGKNTLAAARKYQIKNPSNEVSVSKTPKADKIVAKITALAWAYGTASKKYAYSTGKPKDAMKTAMQKHGYKTKVAYSDCGYCVNTVVMEALGGKFKALGKVKEKFPTNSGWAVVHKGKAVPKGLLKAGDVIRYKKTNGAQHTLFYYGNGKIAEGGRKTRFFVIKKDEGKYNKSNVKKATIEVLRVKE